MAGSTGLEPATSCVTGRRSNQLNYNPIFQKAFGFYLNQLKSQFKITAINKKYI